MSYPRPISIESAKRLYEQANFFYDEYERVKNELSKVKVQRDSLLVAMLAISLIELKGPSNVLCDNVIKSLMQNRKVVGKTLNNTKSKSKSFRTQADNKRLNK